MSERLTIRWTSQAGFDHEETIVGDRLVATVNGTTAVIRVRDADARLRRVHTRTGVDRIDWWPDGGEEVA